MIDFYFEDYLIRDNELVFYIFIGTMLLIMILTLIFVIKEIKNNVNK
jgi:hypothetical protein